MERSINSDIVKPLNKYDDTLAVGTMSDFKLGEVKDFLKLANQAQQKGTPIWEAENGSTDAELNAKILFQNIAKTIVKRCQQQP